MAKEKKEAPKASKAWLETYGDMITLMLCFFVMLFNPTEIDEIQLAQLTVALQGDPTSGGMSLSAGRLADLGNTITSLPALEKGKVLGLAVKKAVSIFAPEINSNKIKVTADERGLVVTLAADSFFRENSAELLIDETRETLLKLAQFLNLSDLKDRKFRIEGHTDSIAPDPALWPSNWELSAARAVNVLHYLVDFGADERRFSVAGYGNTQPQFAEDMPEGRAYNRRVDIIILDEGHF
ncbi:flagellar motor protein MotB [Treponema sp. HNW]|uniref:flagellar motor protein MotB n=1 Tax=Treponema sp. HNW TaxID=3116654 RepID=UPI003D107AE5